MSLALSGSASLSNGTIYLTNSNGQGGLATLSVPPANSFLLRARYQTQSNASAILKAMWGDSSTVAMSLVFTQPTSNISLYQNTTLLATTFAYPFVPNSNNLIAIRQSLTSLKVYVNDVQQLTYSLSNENNPVGGSFSFIGSNGLSNMLSQVAVDPAFTVSNSAEFLADVSVSGSLTAPVLTYLSNNTSTYTPLVQTQAFSNDVYSKAI